MSDKTSRLFPLKPGTAIPGDWCHFPVPLNMISGINTVIDSSSSFKKFFSRMNPGLKVGDHVTIQSTDLATEENAIIEIGDHSYLMGASVIACERISIGSFVYIGFGAVIVDTDFHPSDPEERLRDTVAISPAGNRSLRPAFASMPVIIGDEVWIGFNATILKGVTIGRGAVIQPGAVVSKNVEPFSTVSGNPAIVVTA